MKEKNTEENRNKVARQIIEGWDLETLKNFVIDKLKESYEVDDENFEVDYKSEFGDEN